MNVHNVATRSPDLIGAWHDHGESVYRHAYYLCLDTDLAERVVVQAFSNWRSAAADVADDRFDSVRAHRWVSVAAEHLIAGHQRPVESSQLSEAFLALPLPQREVLVLTDLLDLPVADVASIVRRDVAGVRGARVAGQLAMHDVMTGTPGDVVGLAPGNLAASPSVHDATPDSTTPTRSPLQHPGERT